MKSCTIFGNMAASRLADIYPTKNVCDECIEEDQKDPENSSIANIGVGYDPALGDECAFCGKSFEDEQQELN